MHMLEERFWIDGEWIAPYDEDNEFGSELERLEHEAQVKWDYPHASDYDLIQYLEDLLQIAEDYNRQTGRHLNVYGDIGELYGAVVYGIRLNRLYAPGADGRMGDDHVEIKTISPTSTSGTKYVSTKGNWNKILLVKIDPQFDVRGYLLERKNLPTKGESLKIKWDAGLADAGLPSRA